MKFVGLVSGGKDSIYSIIECQKQGHDLVACVHLARPNQETEESYMYQTAGSEVIQTLVEECLGVPLILHVRQGLTLNTALAYQKTKDDEVEDLLYALRMAKDRFPEVQGVSSGAILSNYQRVRIESVCVRLKMTSLSYLWRLAPQKELLSRMIEDGIDAILVKVAAPPGLTPSRHLGKSLKELQSHFHNLFTRYQFHACGEGGEYESLVVDSPIYKKRLILDETKITEDDDGVGTLAILKCHAVAKTGWRAPASVVLSTENFPGVCNSENQTRVFSRVESQLPHVCRRSCGLLFISEIMSPYVSSIASLEVDAAVAEALTVFGVLRETLERYSCTPEDVTFVHLYLSEMSHFVRINQAYQQFFGVFMPPSRSCVGLGCRVLPGGRRVLMDCIVVTGSGAAQRAPPNQDHDPCLSVLLSSSVITRQVLHVQSVSHWAPVCVGPYSQANTLWEGLHQIAGQIGLVPSTMKLKDKWEDQLVQSWKNVAACLDALDGGSLENVVSAIVYVSTKKEIDEIDCLTEIKKISTKLFQTNAGIISGEIDNKNENSPETCGYEDEETMLAAVGEEGLQPVGVTPPLLLVVSIPEMPVGASVEVEVTAVTKKAMNALQIVDSIENSTRDCEGFTHETNWCSGKDFNCVESDLAAIKIESFLRSIGHGSFGSAIITASSSSSGKNPHLNNACPIFQKMTNCLVSHFGHCEEHLTSVVHVRLLYTSWKSHNPTNDDGSSLRAALSSALGAAFGRNLPAFSVIPVHNINVLHIQGSDSEKLVIKYAMQVTILDPAKLETELWVHHGRQE